MPGHGPPPKPERTRPADNKIREAATTKVIPDGKLRGPILPKGFDWHPRTKAWWLTWRRSPLAQGFTAEDWSFLLDTALLHTAMWEGSTNLAAEIRLRVSAFGATPEARMRLKIKITDEATEVVQAINMDAVRRSRLQLLSD